MDSACDQDFSANVTLPKLGYQSLKSNFKNSGTIGRDGGSGGQLVQPGRCTLHCLSRIATSGAKTRAGKQPALVLSERTLSPIPIPVVIVLVLVDIMDVDTDTPVGAAANPRAPTSVVSPPAPTTATGTDCGTKMRLRLESAATECDPEDCGTVSIRTLVPSITPSTAAWSAAVGQGAVVLQFLLEAV
jgi:hypothetical protein